MQVRKEQLALNSARKSSAHRRGASKDTRLGEPATSDAENAQAASSALAQQTIQVSQSKRRMIHRASQLAGVTRMGAQDYQDGNAIGELPEEAAVPVAVGFDMQDGADKDEKNDLNEKDVLGGFIGGRQTSANELDRGSGGGSMRDARRVRFTVASTSYLFIND